MPNLTSARSAALRLFLPFAAGYFLSYLFRVINAVIAPDLSHEFQLDAADLGLMTSAFFLSFAAFQLPLGILLDRYGSRRTVATLLLVAAIGAFAFAAASNTGALILARAIIGLGVSACLMASFKAFVDGFQADQLPFVNGLLMAFGSLGAFMATTPVERLLVLFDWRVLFNGLGVMTLIASGLIYSIVPRRPEDKKQHNPSTTKALISGLISVLKSSKFWLIAPMTAASQASFIALQSLWNGPWLRDVAQLNRADAAEALSAVAIAMMIGFPLLGATASAAARRGIDPLKIMLASLIVFWCVQSAMLFEWINHPNLLMACFGFFGSAGILSYASLSNQFEKKLAGRVNATLNLAVFASIFLVQWGIGELLSLWSNQQALNDAYAIEGYRWGLGSLLALQILTTTVYWFRRRQITSNTPSQIQ